MPRANPFMQLTTKLCRTCGKHKPRKDFHKRAASKDGLAALCKDCKREEGKARYKADPEYRAKLNRDWNRRNRPRKQELKRKHPQKYKARKAVQNAVARGKLVKPDHCEGCGEKARLEGHHHDYNQPLEVEWLCSGCHSTKGNK